MLVYAALFLIVALGAALLGFSGLAAGAAGLAKGAAGLAKILFWLFLTLFVVRSHRGMGPASWR